MSEFRVATRYAKSLLDLAQEQRLLPAVEADMRLFDQTLKASRDLQLLLQNPIVKSDKKLAVLKAIFSGKVTDLTMKFFLLLTSKARESALGEVATEFLSQHRVLHNVQQATVTSAAPLTAAQRTELQTKLTAQTGQTIELLEKVDAALIGGFVLRIGDRQIDDSVATRLNRLRTSLADHTYENKM